MRLHMLGCGHKERLPVADAERKEFNGKCNEQALRHLMRFEVAVITAFRVKAASAIEQRFAIGQEASSATVLAGLPSPWRSRPQALPAVAAQARIINARREITHEDVSCMMSAIEASWDLDPDLTLGANGGEKREPFGLWMEQLTERAAR